MSGQQPPPTLELELAVARGREYLVRVVFRPPAVVSIGTNPRASITLPDAALPDFHELLHLGPTSWLAFDSDMRVEMQAGGAIADTAALIDKRHAREAREGWRLGLHVGSKGLVRFGELRLLLKVRAARDATIWSVSPDGGPSCGGCGTGLRWTLPAAGAMSPCPKCGDLNRLEGSIADLELGRTSMVPAFGGRRPGAVQPAAADPPFVPDEDDTVSDADVPVVTDELPPPAHRPRGAELPTYDGIAGMKAGDLPTFDAIQVGKAGELPPTSNALKSARRMAEEAAAKEAKPAGLGPRRRGAGVGPGKGADLPTFDAIQVFKEGADLSTRAAISVMKDEEPEPEPAGQDDDTEPPPPRPMQIGPQAAPEPDAPEPLPAVDPDLLVTIKGAPPLKPGEPPPGVTLKPPSAPTPPPAAPPTPPAARPTPLAEQPTPPAAPPPRLPEPPRPPEPPVPEPDTPEPEEPRAPAPPPPRPPPTAPPEPAEVDITADDDDDDDVDTRPTPQDVAPIQPVGPTRQMPVPGKAADSESDLSDAAESDDDFLMGRSDGGIRVQQNLLGWALVGVGLLAGAAGCLLILVAVLFWQGIL